jgi:hypothetical protein
MSKLLANAIETAKPEQIDLCWAVLKYKEIGVYRKVKSLCAAFNLPFEKVVSELPQEEDGRVIDWETRHFIHDSLIKVSKINRE